MANSFRSESGSKEWDIQSRMKVIFTGELGKSTSARVNSKLFLPFIRLLYLVFFRSLLAQLI